MWPPGVVEPDPIAEDAGSVPLRLEAVAMQAMLFQGADEAFDHAILLRAVRGDSLLAQDVATRRDRSRWRI
jgi:hypothetical protein